MAYIDIIDYERSTGQLRDIYDELIRTRGKLADVHMVQSLNPPTIESHMALYKDIMFGRSPLKRDRREMIAVIVSVQNRCDYCVQHHRAALLHFWKDAARADALISDPVAADLSAADLALCRYARQLSAEPGASGACAVDALRTAGLDDREILDATLVIAYFNFVNRIVQGLGLEANSEEVQGYRYD